MVSLTEKDIMKNWKSEDEDTKLVSIKCMAYNHERYITDALDSFLMQKTDFPFEVVIHDDASTDDTANIIVEYQKRYPNIVKPIYEKENQYSKGNGIINRIMDSQIRGKYVAMCEGDDYWIDEYKLQKQFNAMEKHPDVDVCAHAVKKVDAKTGKSLGIIAPESTEMVIPIENVIAGGGGFVGTNSLFYRKKAFETTFPFRKIIEIDYTLQVQGAIRGGMLYMPMCMSAYRCMTDDSWSSIFHKVKKEEDLSAQVRWNKMLEQIDVDTDRKYTEAVKEYMGKCEIDQAIRFKDYSAMKKYKDFYKCLNGNERKKYWIKVRLPRLYSALRKIKEA